MQNQMEKQAVKAKKILVAIDQMLDTLEDVDPYGDMLQNFEDDDRTRVTTRLVGMIDEDLTKGHWK